MNNLKKKLTNGIYASLKKINNLASLNIDFEKTSKEYISDQISTKFLKNFTNNYESGDIKDIDSFIIFLQKNQTNIKKITIFLKNSNKNIYLKTIISKFLKESQKNIISSKLFYFYLNLILVENFYKTNKISRDVLKKRIEEIINNNCLSEKKKLLSCLFINNSKIEVVPINNFEKSIDKNCRSQKNKIEQCLKIPTQFSLTNYF